MFKFFGATTGKHSAIAKAQVRSIIENGDVALAKQTGNCAERSAKAAVEKHCVFAVEKLCDSRFQFAMKIGHAREHGRTACAQTVTVQGFMSSSDDIGMVRQTEIIIRIKIDDGLRFAVVSNAGE